MTRTDASHPDVATILNFLIFSEVAVNCDLVDLLSTRNYPIIEKPMRYMNFTRPERNYAKYLDYCPSFWEKRRQS